MNPILDQIAKTRVVPVIAIENAADAPALGRALLAGGLPLAEITFRTAAGEEAIRRMAAEVPEVLVGAGTVLNAAQAQAALSAGAKFIVSPGLDAETVKFCLQKNIPVFPGCATPSEMQCALNLGLTHLKFFPAQQAGGLAYLKAVSAAYTMLRFIPTGGIGPGNLREYLAFGKIIACGGSWMCQKDLICAGKWEEITRLCGEAAAIAKGWSQL
ncbi:MAG: bifunctional 4-hydroxy-2-oxoglutarate aldolase/2-dehydro-3-deoxy-phosphogluconate aldolase [Firmicutes bacterium]|nr:bifunctional 4-hydroxy-2-oxoglutarate aldolase/2-dehydro-3-deoxy-phosphogluconate aldolase [Bacillota bacterium]